MDWQPYDYLSLDKSALDKQVKSLWHSGLTINDARDVTLVLNEELISIEDSIICLYDKLKTENTVTGLCNEVFFTSKIEGAVTTLARTFDIHNGAKINEADFSEQMILGGFRATELLNQRMCVIDDDSIIELWRTLTEGCRQNEEVCGNRYRSGKIFVGRHEGVPYEKLEVIMTKWLYCYNGPFLQEHPFIKTALLHGVFEYIHPFCDGNGRLGRLLMQNYPVWHGYKKLQAVSFSKSIDARRDRYDTALADADNYYLDFTPVVSYLLNVFPYTLYVLTRDKVVDT